MKILIACEFSGIVREAFKAKGHDSWSCDFLPSEIEGNHLQSSINRWKDRSRTFHGIANAMADQWG